MRFCWYGSRTSRANFTGFTLLEGVLRTFLAVDLAGLAAMVPVGTKGAFRLIFHGLHVTSIAAVHVLRIIPVVEFLGFVACFRNSVIDSFGKFRNAAGAHARIDFFLDPLIGPDRF